MPLDDLWVDLEPQALADRVAREVAGRQVLGDADVQRSDEGEQGAADAPCPDPPQALGRGQDVTGELGLPVAVDDAEVVSRSGAAA